jgi:peptidoglycan/LPS O-acetylase OafA/YrhL
MSKTSLALNNLRGFAIVIVVAFHSCIAYVQTQPAAAVPFDEPPYRWTANPIIDADRWLGFDLFCAFTFLFMMQLMFFLSGLFVWPSLVRKGERAFLLDRFLRIGVPFLIGTLVLMPLTYFAVYRVTAADPSFAAFWPHWIALPFWVSGPMWFLWVLLALNIAAVLLFRLAPRSVELLVALLRAKSDAPGRFFVIVVAVTALAYVPLSAIFTPWQWVGLGPFSLQPVMAPQYLIYFVAGIAVGAHGLEGGLLSAEGLLARRWPAWVVGCLASFAVWVASTALIFNGRAFAGVQLVADLAFVLFTATTCLAFAALFLRFAARDWPRFAALGEYGYGIYLFHYLFVIWTQYLLLGVSMPAIVKGATVFAATLALSFAATALLCRIPGGEHLIRGQRRMAIERGAS